MEHWSINKENICELPGKPISQTAILTYLDVKLYFVFSASFEHLGKKLQIRSIDAKLMNIHVTLISLFLQSVDNINYQFIKNSLSLLMPPHDSQSVASFICNIQRGQPKLSFELETEINYSLL